MNTATEGTKNTAADKAAIKPCRHWQHFAEGIHCRQHSSCVVVQSPSRLDAKHWQRLPQGSLQEATLD